MARVITTPANSYANYIENLGAVKIWLDASDLSTITRTSDFAGGFTASGWKSKFINSDGLRPEFTQQSFSLVPRHESDIVGRKCMRFENYGALGDRKLMTISNSSHFPFSSGAGIENGYTIMCVCRPNYMQGGLRRFVFDFGQYANNGVGLYFRCGRVGAYCATDNGGANVNTQTNYPSGFPIFIAMSVRFGASNGSMQVYLNETQHLNVSSTLTQLTSSEIASGTTHATASGPPTIGGQSKSLLHPARCFDGDIYELVVSASYLSHREIHNFYSSMKSKWSMLDAPSDKKLFFLIDPSVYDGLSLQSTTAITGSTALDDASFTATGTSTSYLSELSAGQPIMTGGSTQTQFTYVDSVQSDIQFTLAEASTHQENADVVMASTGSGGEFNVNFIPQHGSSGGSFTAPTSPLSPHLVVGAGHNRKAIVFDFQQLTAQWQTTISGSDAFFFSDTTTGSDGCTVIACVLVDSITTGGAIISTLLSANTRHGAKLRIDDVTPVGHTSRTIRLELIIKQGGVEEYNISKDFFSTVDDFITVGYKIDTIDSLIKLYINGVHVKSEVIGPVVANVAGADIGPYIGKSIDENDGFFGSISGLFAFRESKSDGFIRQLSLECLERVNQRRESHFLDKNYLFSFIADYDNFDLSSVQGTGTISGSASSETGTVTGSATAFTTELSFSNIIKFRSHQRVYYFNISNIVSDTEIELSGNVDRSFSGVNYDILSSFEVAGLRNIAPKQGGEITVSQPSQAARPFLGNLGKSFSMSGSSYLVTSSFAQSLPITFVFVMKFSFGTSGAFIVDELGTTSNLDITINEGSTEILVSGVKTGLSLTKQPHCFIIEVASSANSSRMYLDGFLVSTIDTSSVTQITDGLSLFADKNGSNGASIELYVMDIIASSVTPEEAKEIANTFTVSEEYSNQLVKIDKHAPYYIAPVQEWYDFGESDSFVFLDFSTGDFDSVSSKGKDTQTFTQFTTEDKPRNRTIYGRRFASYEITTNEMTSFGFNGESVIFGNFHQPIAQGSTIVFVMFLSSMGDSQFSEILINANDDTGQHGFRFGVEVLDALSRRRFVFKLYTGGSSATVSVNFPEDARQGHLVCPFVSHDIVSGAGDGRIRCGTLGSSTSDIITTYSSSEISNVADPSQNIRLGSGITFRGGFGEVFQIDTALDSADKKQRLVDYVESKYGVHPYRN